MPERREQEARSFGFHSQQVLNPKKAKPDKRKKSIQMQTDRKDLTAKKVLGKNYARRRYSCPKKLIPEAWLRFLVQLHPRSYLAK